MVQRNKYVTHFRHVIRAAFLIVGAVLANITCAQLARMEVVPFQSVTLTDEEFLAGREDGKPVTVAGELRLPRAGTDRLPLVILLHGSGGISGYIVEWCGKANAPPTMIREAEENRRTVFRLCPFTVSCFLPVDAKISRRKAGRRGRDLRRTTLSTNRTTADGRLPPPATAST